MVCRGVLPEDAEKATALPKNTSKNCRAARTHNLDKNIGNASVAQCVGVETRDALDGEAGW